ncbi:MAG: hypothetical protein ACFFBV_12595 [Promethearchaeota archaeon]
MSNADKIISLNITKFPQNLLIPDIDNAISIQAINHSGKLENFKFNFEGENLEIVFESEDLKNEIKFGPGEAKNIDIKLVPTADGFGKLNINVYWVKVIEYKVKVQKVRETVQTSKIKVILERYTFSTKETVEIFNPEEFFIDMTEDVIKQAEEQLKTLKNNYNSLQSINTKTPELLKEIDAYIKQLAKGYLSINNPLKALEFALILSDKNEQIIFYMNLVRAYAFKNFDEMLQLVKNLQDLDIQQNLFKFLALDQAQINPERAVKVGILVQNPSIKENLLINIFGKIIESNPLLALKLIENIDDSILKAKTLFNIAKKLYEEDARTELINILNSIIGIAIKSFEQYSTNKKFRKLCYKLLKNAIHALAEIDSTTKADSIIKNITIQELKEKISKDLFNVIYVMVDEIRTKMESKVVFSQYFLLNTYISTVNNDIKNFSLTGGNVSSNILINDFKFNITFLSLFGFDFSIFPILDRVYNDLKYSLNKSIAYYVFPSKENYNENELKTLTNSLRQFFKNIRNAPGHVFVINLDFIPYLGKPTVIVSDGNELDKSFYSKVKKLGETINLIFDDSLFKGGTISDNLKQIFPPDKCKIINLVLSYEFINDYDIFKTFIQSLL